MKTAAGSALAFGTGGLLNGCGKKDSISGPEPAPEINATVAAVRGDNLDSMTREAIEAIGGMESVVHEGEVVFIKPNFVSFNLAENRECFWNGECTKPEILIATAEECLRAGAREVIIGDGSQKITYSWEPSYTRSGSENLVQAAARLNAQYPGDVTLSCLETDYPGDFEIPSSTAHGRLYISTIYNRIDRIISIPVAKTHTSGQLTLALKNFIGVLSIQRYGVFLNNSYWDRGQGIDHSTVSNLSQAFLDVVAAKVPDLTIIDFSIGVEGDGPTAGGNYGSTVDVRDRLGSWMVLASKDIMAADATAARIMSHPVSIIRQLQMGYDMGLGEINHENIEVIGERLADITMDWEPAELRNQLEKGFGCRTIAEQFGNILKTVR